VMKLWEMTYSFSSAFLGRQAVERRHEGERDARGEDAACGPCERDLSERRLGFWMWQHGVHGELVRGEDRGVHECDAELRDEEDLESALLARCLKASKGTAPTHHWRGLQEVARAGG